MNRLINETSLYLLEHANNPVDWYPWGSEAIEKARQENKPILLSIGYAACHWCHVMARESFEDSQTASLMNQFFINIKVDREERPDLDKIYQINHEILTGQRGGWPLTVFLSADSLVPFFSGTYFPLRQQFLLPSFMDILRAMHDFYHRYTDQIKKQGDKIVAYFNSLQTLKNFNKKFNDSSIRSAVELLSQQYDEVHGGFGEAPKFPQPVKLEFLLSHKPQIVYNTLLHMASGGLYDHLQGGFFRYSTDKEWKIPHFEKMLYDNSQLLQIYSLAAYFFNDSLFKQVLHHTARWIIDEMRSSNGGYCSSVNADSDGIEGKFYIWNKEEVKRLLTESEYKIIEPYYHLDNSPNFEENWHFYTENNLNQIAKRLNYSFKEVVEILESAKNKLLTARNLRTKPSRDNKILTSWNALAIKALAIAGKFHNEPSYYDAAENAFNFIKSNLWRDNKLYSSYPNNNLVLGFIDDYAFLLDAVLTLLEIKWSNDYFNFAISIANQLIEQFYDEQAGGFFFTAHDHEKVIYRPKLLADESTPSGNAIAAQSLLNLGYLIGETKYIEIAENTLNYAWPSLMQHPAEYCSFLILLKQILEPSSYIVITGDINEIIEWKNKCNKIRPEIKVYAISSSHTLPESFSRKIIGVQNSAYICSGKQCSQAIKNLEDLINSINK